MVERADNTSAIDAKVGWYLSPISDENNTLLLIHLMKNVSHKIPVLKLQVLQKKLFNNTRCLFGIPIPTKSIR